MTKRRHYRIVTHAHSNWSYDGSWTIAELAEKMSRHGAHILMMSEHSQRFDHEQLDQYVAECASASNDRIRVIPGIEYSSPKNRIHILTWGLKHYLGEELDPDIILDAVAEADGIAVLAHPSRRDIWRDFKEDWATKLYAIELWNRKTDGLTISPHALELIRRHQTRAIVSLDFHNKRQLYPIYNKVQTSENLFKLSNDEIIQFIKENKLSTHFLGLRINENMDFLSKSTLFICNVLSFAHRLVFRRK